MDEPLVIDIAAGPVALAARCWPGDGARRVLLVHGLSSNARLWDEVAARLAAEGHPVVAVDLRGHGASAAVPDPQPETSASTSAADPGHEHVATLTAAADLAEVCGTLGWAGLGAAGGAGLAPDLGTGFAGDDSARPGRGIVVAGQSWGGNVALQLAADRPDLVHGLALVDGGWLHLGDRWSTLDAAWEVLAPPVFDGLTAVALRARLAAMHPDWSDGAVDATMGNLRELPDGTVMPWLDRDRHRAIVASMLAHQPRELYPRIACRTLLLAALGTGPDAVGKRAQLDEAVATLRRPELVEFPGADHDLHAQHPNRIAALIGSLA